MNDIEKSVFFSDWFIINVAEHASPKTMVQLKQVSAFNNRYITKKFIKSVIISNIHKRLKVVLNEHYDYMIRHIVLNKVIISGSFIIQCILDEYWEDSDIDLYSPHNNSASYNFLDVFGEKINLYEHNDAYANVLPIHTIINNKLSNGQKLQHIYMKESFNSNDILDDSTKIFKSHMIGNFDLDICKNMFTIINGKQKLYIHNLNKIIMKKEFATNFGQPDKAMKRIKKYNLRGFDFNCGNYTFSRGRINPHLVYKFDDCGKLDKLTFLGTVYTATDIIEILDCWDGFVSGYTFDNTDIHDQIVKFNSKTNGTTIVFELKRIFTFLLQNSKDNIYDEKKCTCTTSFNHEHVKCPVHFDGKKIGCDMIMVNYSDLTNDLKVKYNTLFDTNKCELGFLKMNELGIGNILMYNKIRDDNLDLDVLEEEEEEEEEDVISNIKIMVQNKIDKLEEELKTKNDMVIEEDINENNRIITMDDNEQILIKVMYTSDDSEDNIVEKIIVKNDICESESEEELYPIKNIQTESDDDDEKPMHINNKTCASEYIPISKDMFKLKKLLLNMKQN
jgi:hypothetical protein